MTHTTLTELGGDPMVRDGLTDQFISEAFQLITTLDLPACNQTPLGHDPSLDPKRTNDRLAKRFHAAGKTLSRPVGRTAELNTRVNCVTERLYASPSSGPLPLSLDFTRESTDYSFEAPRGQASQYELEKQHQPEGIVQHCH